MDDCGVVPTTKLLPYRGVRYIEVLSQDVHNYLSGAYYLLVAGLLINTLLFNIVEIGNNSYHIFYRHNPLGFYVVFDIVSNIRHRNLLSLKFKLAQKGVDRALKLADIAVNGVGQVIDYLRREGYSLLDGLCRYNGDSGLFVRGRDVDNHAGA